MKSRPRGSGTHVLYYSLNCLLAWQLLSFGKLHKNFPLNCSGNYYARTFYMCEANWEMVSWKVNESFLDRAIHRWSGRSSFSRKCFYTGTHLTLSGWELRMSLPTCTIQLGTYNKWSFLYDLRSYRRLHITVTMWKNLNQPGNSFSACQCKAKEVDQLFKKRFPRYLLNNQGEVTCRPLKPMLE